MPKLALTAKTPILDLMDAGFPNPERDSGRFLAAVRAYAARQIEAGAIDLDEATRLVEAAFERIRYVTPLLMRDYRSDAEAEVLEDLWDALAA